MNGGPNAAKVNLYISRDSLQTAKRLGRCVGNCFVGPLLALRGSSSRGNGTPPPISSWRNRTSNVFPYTSADSPSAASEEMKCGHRSYLSGK